MVDYWKDVPGIDEAEKDDEVIISWEDINGKVSKKKFKTRKSFNRFVSKNEGKGKVKDFIKYPEGI